MEKVPDGVYKGVMIKGNSSGTEDVGVTTLLTVGVTKCRTFVVGMSWGMSSTGGTAIIGTVGTKVVGGLACVVLGRNVWTGVAGS